MVVILNSNDCSLSVVHLAYAILSSKLASWLLGYQGEQILLSEDTDIVTSDR
jgi:hypothetical protein